MNRKGKRRKVLMILFVILLFLVLFDPLENRQMASGAKIAAMRLLQGTQNAALSNSSNTNKKRKAVSDTAQDKLVSAKKIALTFDDGPSPVYTPPLLDGLKERDVKASFFVTGENAELYPELIKRMYEEGHLIGNHTYHHVQLTKSNGADFEQEIISTNVAIQKITGQETAYIRPPFGSWDKKLEEKLNMFPVLWNIDPLDWCRKDVSGIVKSVVSKAEENDIILMHDQYESSVKAALRIVDELSGKGYDFVTVEEILFD